MSSIAMPAQSGDPISSALHQSLSSVKKCKGGEEIDSRIYDKQILLAEIQYEKTKCSNINIYSELKSKYISLSTVNCSGTKSDEVTSSKDSVISDVSSPKKTVPCSKEPTSLPTPKRILYSPDAVRLGWSGSVPVGSGFVNLGNTCYLNSSLQALFHVPAFVNWLLSDTNHSSKCESMNGVTHSECLICAMSKTLLSSQKCTNSVVKPIQIYSKLKLICRHLTHGHQEDAHEFLRYLIEGMERSYLTIFNGIKLDNYSKETTPLSQIFGGYLRSEVTCLECQHVSTTFQHFQDLLLDIRTASSVDDALESYFSRERLGDGDQAYRCEQCKRRVAATKKFTIERPPKALCIALKRFGAMGGKNSKTISMKQSLDINKYRHRPSPDPCLYKLVSMVSHLGPSSSCGHYTAVGQTASGTYYLFDDNLVRPLQIQNVLNSNPYILMYELDTENKKQQPTPKKEILSNGFSNSNGTSSSGKDTKPSTPINNILSLSNNSASVSTPPSSELRPNQNGLGLQNKNQAFKLQYFGRPRMTLNQAGTSSPKATLSDEQSSSSQQKQEFTNLPPQNTLQNTFPQVNKDQVGEIVEKPSVSPDRGSTKRQELPQTSPLPTHSSVSPSLLQPSPVSSLLPSPGSLSPEKENSISKIPLPDSTPEKTMEKQVHKITEDFKSNSSPLSLVPYGSDASSESDGEFIPPKSSPTKDLTKSAPSSGRTSPSLPNAKGVRIEIEGWESASNHLPGHNRPDLHSPAGSTSSGKWSVTSAERDRTPEKQEKPFTSKIIIERNDRLSNGSNSNGMRNERWDDSRSNNSTIDHLMKTSHHGYGYQVKSWTGRKSEMDQQVESERHHSKRSHESYNDEYDRGKVKKIKYQKKGGFSNGRNRFQDEQNRKNMRHGDHHVRLNPHYYPQNRQKPQFSYSNSRSYWN